MLHVVSLIKVAVYLKCIGHRQISNIWLLDNFYNKANLNLNLEVKEHFTMTEFRQNIIMIILPNDLKYELETIYKHRLTWIKVYVNFLD